MQRNRDARGYGDEQHVLMDRSRAGMQSQNGIS